MQIKHSKEYLIVSNEIGDIKCQKEIQIAKQIKFNSRETPKNKYILSAHLESSKRTLVQNI